MHTKEPRDGLRASRTHGLLASPYSAQTTPTHIQQNIIAAVAGALVETHTPSTHINDALRYVLMHLDDDARERDSLKRGMPSAGSVEALLAFFDRSRSRSTLPTWAPVVHSRAVV